MKLIERGHPDVTADIHALHPDYKKETLCRGGGYDVQLTEKKKYVTCKHCKARLAA